MTDRWNPKRVTVATPQPVRVVMTETQQGAVEPMGKTWGMRVRGDVTKRAPQLYRCPVHGEFTREVPMSGVPDAVECLWRDEPGTVDEPGVCRTPSPWAGSQCGIGHAAGEVMS